MWRTEMPAGPLAGRLPAPTPRRIEQPSRRARPRSRSYTERPLPERHQSGRELIQRKSKSRTQDGERRTQKRWLGDEIEATHSAAKKPPAGRGKCMMLPYLRRQENAPFALKKKNWLRTTATKSVGRESYYAPHAITPKVFSTQIPRSREPCWLTSRNGISGRPSAEPNLSVIGRKHPRLSVLRHSSFVPLHGPRVNPVCY